MELSNSEILFISHILVKLLKQDIELKNQVDDIHDTNASRRQLRKGMLRSGELDSLDDDLCKTSAFAEPQILDNQFKEFSVQKRKRGRPFGSFKKVPFK